MKLTNEIENFIIEYAKKDNGVNLLNLYFIRDFQMKFSPDKKVENSLRNILNKMVDAGKLKKQRYYFGGGRREIRTNNRLPSSMMVYLIPEQPAQ